MEPGTHNLDPELIEAAITERTTAILPVHIGGRPADMDRVNEIAARCGLRVVEDAGQAWLAGWRGRRVGTLGQAGAFSFQSSKNLTAGEGGMPPHERRGAVPAGVVLARLRTRSGGRAARVRTRRSQPPDDRVPGGHTVLRAGEVCRPSRPSAGKPWTRCPTGLAGVDGVLVPGPDERITSHGCHIFMVRLDESGTEVDRNWVIEALRAEGVPVHPGYTTPLQRGLPVCEALCRTTIWIKHEVLLGGAAEMRDVVNAFAKVLSAARTAPRTSERRLD